MNVNYCRLIPSWTPPEPETPVAPDSQISPPRADLVLSDAVQAARKNVVREPKSADTWLVLGRQLRRQSMHREAVEAFSHGLCHNFMHHLLFRHRAQNYLNIGRYYEAAADFNLALRIEPHDFDCWYHLGVAYYLMRDYAKCAEIMGKAANESNSDADRVSSIYWSWFALMRLGEHTKAKTLLDTIGENLNLVTCSSFYQVLMMCKGLRTPQELLGTPDNTAQNAYIIIQYGVAAYYYTQGDDKAADQTLETLLANDTEKRWAGFGYQAASVDYSRRSEQEVTE